MSQEDQNPNLSTLKIFGSILMGVIACAGLVWAIYSDRSEDSAVATQIAKQDIQIALSEEQNSLLTEQLTASALKATVDEQQRMPLPENSSNSAATATARALQSLNIEATTQALEEKQQKIEATQTAFADPWLSYKCSLGQDFIPDLGGSRPPIDREVCIPEGRIAWISSDSAYFSIPNLYNEPPTVGFTFALFGPVKFTISGVREENVRLDVRQDASLVGNYDGKSLNLVYRNGKVCEHTDYSGLSCP